MGNYSVIGAGSWGTALARALAKNGHDVTVWSIMEDEIQMLNEKREHELKLPGVKLPDTILFTTDLEKAIKGKEMMILAAPSSNSTCIFNAIKFTVASFTPAVFFAASSILFAQLAQSTSILYAFFIASTSHFLLF